MTNIIPMSSSIPVPVTQHEVGSKSASNNGEMEAQLKALGELLSELQITIAKFANTSESNHFKINNGYLKAAQQEVTKAIQDLRAEQEEKAKEANESFWQRLEGGLMSALSCILAACTLQPELIALTVAFTLMQYTGGMKHLEKVLTTAFEKMGIPADVAKLLGDVTILIASVAITHGASGAMLTEEAAASTAIKATDEVPEDASMFTKVKAKVSSFGKGVSRQTAASLVAGSQAMMNTNLTPDAVALLAKATGNQKLQILLEVVMELMAAIMGGAGMNNLASREVAVKLPELMEKARGPILAASAKMMLADMGGQVATDVLQGITDMSLGNTTYDLTSAKAQASFYNGLMKELDSGFSGWMDTVSFQEGNESKALGSLGEAYAGVNGVVARELAV